MFSSSLRRLGPGVGGGVSLSYGAPKFRRFFGSALRCLYETAPAGRWLAGGWAGVARESSSGESGLGAARLDLDELRTAL